jgi:hypothetical protein
MRTNLSKAVVALALLASSFRLAGAASVLFDATKHEMAGNADWVIDADAWDQSLPAYPCTGTTNESRPLRFPTPPQSGITPSTPETYWTGGISSWAIDLVKAGHTVETLPTGATITFGDQGNPQDLSHYQLYVIVEPQNPFTAAEKTAILAFVNSGGGLFMVADHETSDRDCDGWDAPHVFNDLTGAVSTASAGVFGIWFRVNGVEDQGGEDWFDDGVDANVETSPADPIINGPFGSGAGGLGLFGSTSMDLSLADNPTATAHVWRTGQAHGSLRVTFATAAYGAGRVAAIGDSSPADDATGDPSDSLYPGWDKASGGVKNREIHLNACHWLLHPAPDVTPPVITSGPAAAASDCSATVTFTTDEASTSVVEYGPTPAYGASASAPGLVQSHAVTLSPLVPATPYHYRASTADSVGNGPTQSDDLVFTTAAAAPPVIATGPSATTVSGTSATVTWTTDEASTSDVEYGETIAYGNTASGAPGAIQHDVTLSPLAVETTYHYRVLSTDACGAGPTTSADATFTTGPASIDVSGWTLKQYNAALTFVIPPGTTIPSGGYLVVGRDATRASFEAVFPSMPAGTVYLDSDADGSCSTSGCFPQVNGGESFELYDAANAKQDGATVAMSTTHRAYQRVHPGDPPGDSASWAVVAESLANPGTGAGTGSASGVRINEMADAANFSTEFVELYYDPAPSGPDVVPPAPVADLVAHPLSASTIRLTFTATGDDGTVGTAASYDLRRSAQRILTDADFSAATPVVPVPLPKVAGSAETIDVAGLAADTAYYFALEVIDDAAHASSVSNVASAVTGPAGGGTSVSHLVISQIRISGSADDVVELYNPTPAPIALTGTSLQYLAANGNFGFRVNLTGANSVPSHGWYLIAANSYAGSPARDDSMGTSNLSNAAGHALLVAKTTNVSGCSDAAIVDKVGYGASASCPEGGSGHAAATPGSGLSISRKPADATGNGQDTDLNDADFNAPSGPGFRNRFSTPAIPASALGNVKNTLFLAKDAFGAELTWANASAATGYRVYRGTSADFMAVNPPPWASPAANGATDAETPAEIFFYVVHAVDGAGESAE